MGNPDWIPRREHDLLDMIGHWNRIVGDGAKRAAFDWPDEECEALQKAMLAFADACALYREAPTGSNKVGKDADRRCASDAMRAFARDFVRCNRKMPHIEKDAMDVAVAGRGAARDREREETPESHAVTSPLSPGVVRLRCRKRRPHRAIAVEVGWELTDALAQPPNTFFNHEIFTRNPWKREFRQDRGKCLYYAMRYVFSGEKRGPWSATRGVIVP
jgi:hypothetical protein